MTKMDLSTPDRAAGDFLPMTPLEAKIVVIVWSAPTPCSRKQIASALGRTVDNLNWATVNRLVEHGWLKEERERLPVGLGFRCVYSKPDMPD